MAQAHTCISLKIGGERCTRQVMVGERCNQHQAIHLTRIQQLGEPRHNGCSVIMNGPRRWCPHDVEENALICRAHRLTIERRVARAQNMREIEDTVGRIYGDYWNINPRPVWRTVVDRIVLRRIAGEITDNIAHRAARRYFFRTAGHETWVFGQYWDWAVNGRVGPMPIEPQALPRGIIPLQNLNQLAVIAADRQNVHTRMVSQQTNAGLEKLLAFPLPNRRHRIPDWFAARWLIQSYGNWDFVKRTVDDMQLWYKQASCRAIDDHLYKKALDGLFYLIRSVTVEDTKTELFKRVFEECSESVGLCCDGHISRICNVLVGFDDTFTTPLSTGEVLQNEIAVIAGKDSLSLEEKIHQANIVFERLGIAQPDRTAWIEALE